MEEDVTIGILVICLTARGKRNHACPITYKVVITNTKDQDSDPQYVVTGNLNSDSWLDFVVVTTDIDSIKIFLGYGNGSFANQTTYSTGIGSRPYSLAIGDFNNDSYPNIVVANYGNENIGLFLGYGNGTFGNYITYSTSFRSRPFAITVLGFNKDNRLDIAISNDGTNNVAILSGNSNVTFGALTVYDTGYNTRPCAIAVSDYNNGRETDIVVTECSSDNIGIISKLC